MLQAVIFDMDGLLLNSEPFWNKAYVDVLGMHGFVVTETEVEEMLGSGLRTSDEIKLLSSIFDWGAYSNDTIGQQVNNSFVAQIRANREAMPGVRALTTLLHAHKIPMAIASSSTLDIIETVVESLGLKKYIRHLHSGENEILGKPHPDVFLSAAKKLKVKPENCLVFEDSLHGVKAAKAAGTRCIAVPFVPYNQAAFSIADLVVGSLYEVSWEIMLSLWGKTNQIAT